MLPANLNIYVRTFLCFECDEATPAKKTLLVNVRKTPFCPVVVRKKCAYFLNLISSACFFVSVCLVLKEIE